MVFSQPGYFMFPKMTVSDAARFLNVSSQAVIKKIKIHNLSFHKKQNRIFFGHSTAKEVFNIKNEPKIFAFQIVKGGTGKSNLAMNIAVRLSLYGLKTLCIDLDQQANLTTLMNINLENFISLVDIIESNGQLKIEENLVQVSDGLYILPGKLESAKLDDLILTKGLGMDRVYKDLISPLKEKFDVIIIDCPPALGRSVGAAAFASDEIIAPVIPDKLCLLGLNLLDDSLKQLASSRYGRSVPFRIVYNKFDSRTSLSKEILAGLLRSPIYKDKLIDTYIRNSQEIPKTCIEGMSLFDSLKPSLIKDDIDSLSIDLLNLKTPTTKTMEISHA